MLAGRPLGSEVAAAASMCLGCGSNTYASTTAALLRGDLPVGGQKSVPLQERIHMVQRRTPSNFELHFVRSLC